MRRKKSNSLSDIFWNFIKENPKVLAGLAFQLGEWAGETTVNIKAFKRAGKIPAQLLHNIPDGISEAALRLLPSPALQPNNAKVRARRRKPNGSKAAVNGSTSTMKRK